MSMHHETADQIINVMIVDDDSFIVESLATILSAQPDINVCATTSSGTEAVRIYAKLASEGVSRETFSARTTKKGAADATAAPATTTNGAAPDNATAASTAAILDASASTMPDAATATPTAPDSAAPTPDTIAAASTPAVPDVLLMDIRMPDGDGLSAAERILANYPQARIVFLTTFADDDYIVRALRMGARGYLIKQDVATIAPALRSVMAGQNVLGSEVMERAFFLGNVSREASAEPSAALSPASASTPSASPSPAATSASAAPAAPFTPVPSVAASTPTTSAAPFPALTERERRIVELVAQGLDNREIAGIVYVSEGTVRNHISAILSKLNLRNRTQIAVHYWRSLSR